MSAIWEVVIMKTATKKEREEGKADELLIRDTVGADCHEQAVALVANKMAAHTLDRNIKVLAKHF